MRFALFLIAITSSTAALAQNSYVPHEVRISRGSHQTNNCVTGTIRVSDRDDVTISLRPCRTNGSAQGITVRNQQGGIVAGSVGSVTVTNSPGAIVGNGNVEEINMSNGTVIIAGATDGMMLSGGEETIVRRCLASARVLRLRDGDSTYVNCLRGGLHSLGFRVN